MEIHLFLCEVDLLLKAKRLLVLPNRLFINMTDRQLPDLFIYRELWDSWSVNLVYYSKKLCLEITALEITERTVTLEQ